MIEVSIFLFGLLIGALVVYFVMSRKTTTGIAAHAKNQQNEKQSRKDKILEILRERNSLTNDDIEKVLGVSDASATNYLQELEREGKIEQVGERGRFVSYRPKK
ncbi:DUF977 family protein [Candidatus Uhrbacteria bacterium]|nr:DUF977 family protein [Candidatus Uhrbacteria bacterium]